MLPTLRPRAQGGHPRRPASSWSRGSGIPPPCCWARERPSRLRPESSPTWRGS